MDEYLSSFDDGANDLDYEVNVNSSSLPNDKKSFVKNEVQKATVTFDLGFDEG